MKVILLAGGYGTRLADYSSVIPKPMVTIGNKPILWRIMNHYAEYGHHDFYVALGYKSEVIKEYFLNYYTLNNDFSVNLASGDIEINQVNKLNWRVTLADTGLNTMTGGRLKKMKKYIGGDTFLLSYGDGISDVNITKLLEFHISHGKIGTMTIIRPPGRFGELEVGTNSEILYFKEKPKISKGWINGGFFVFNKSFFNYVSEKNEMLEEIPLNKLSKDNQLVGYKHDGFWASMDTLRDKNQLNNLWNNNLAKWKIWE